MKKILVTILALGLFAGNVAYAGSCEIPRFLKKDRTYGFSLSMVAFTGKVLEIDSDSCWVKVAWTRKRDSGVEWFNLKTISGIEEK